MYVNKNWTVEYTDEFEAWWVELTEGMQDDIDRVVMLLGASHKNSVCF